MQDHTSTLASWAGAIAKTLEQRGVDSQAVFVSAGLDIDKIRDSNARFSGMEMARLWRACTEASADPAFGLGVYQNRSSTTFHGVGMALEASSTLRELIDRLIKFSRLISTVAEIKLRQRGDKHWLLEWYIEPSLRPHIADEALDGFLASGVSYLAAEDLIEVHFIRPEPADPSPWHECFHRAPIHFSSTMDALVLAQTAIDKPLQEANPALAQAGESVAMDYLQKMERQDILLQVSAEISKRLALGEPKQQEIASVLNLSVRQLQRKLTAKGTRFSQILQELRHQLAKENLRDSSLSILEISLNLGFSDASNFSSAFKRWQGVSPKDYRQASKIK